MSLRRTDVRGSVRTQMTDEELLRAQGFERVESDEHGRDRYADTLGDGHVVTRETALRWARKDSGGVRR